jgi:uncharacterized protein YijF (DUF1287 family)
MADAGNLIHEVKQQLAQVESVKSNARWAFDNPMAYGYWTKDFQEFAQLQKTVSENVQEVLGNIEGIAGSSENYQYILFLSFFSLPEKDALRCLDKIADLGLSKAISSEMFRWSMSGYSIVSKPEYTLTLKYKDPTVAGILRKAKVIYPEYREIYDSMLSGEALRELVIDIEDTGEPKPANWDDLLAGSRGMDVIQKTTGESKASKPNPVFAESTNEAKDIGLAIVEAARSQIGKTVEYDSKYVLLEYPMGDIPIETGVCTDVIVRALRDALGIDLQQLIHEDMKNSFLLYPKRWGLKLPDKSIDHRRVLNQKKYFERKGFSIPVSDKPGDYLPGDIVTCIVYGNLPHIMIVSDKKDEQGIPLVIHNIGIGTREESSPLPADVTGHYRMTHKGKQSILNNGVVLIGVAIVIGVILAWRFFRKKRA